MKKNNKNTSAQNPKPLFIIASLLLFLVCSFATAQHTLKLENIATTTVVPLFNSMAVAITTPNLDDYQQSTGGLAAPPMTVPHFNPQGIVYLQAQTDRDMKEGTSIEWRAHSGEKPSRVVASSNLHATSGGNAFTTPMTSWNLQNSGFESETVILTVIVTEPGSLVRFTATKEIYISAQVN